MTGGNKQRLQMPARGAESVTEDGVARPGVPDGGRECARRWLRAGWMDRIRLLWSLGSLTLWPIPSGGGASPGRNALPQARALCGAFLAGQTAEEAQGSGRSQGQVVTRQGPGNRAALPNRNLHSNKTRGTIQKKYFLSFCSARSPARQPFQVFTKTLSSHAPAVIGGGKRCAVPLSSPWFLNFQCEATCSPQGTHELDAFRDHASPSPSVLHLRICLLHLVESLERKQNASSVWIWKRRSLSVVCLRMLPAQVRDMAAMVSAQDFVHVLPLHPACAISPHMPLFSVLCSLFVLEGKRR